MPRIPFIKSFFQSKYQSGSARMVAEKTAENLDLSKLDVIQRLRCSNNGCSYKVFQYDNFSTVIPTPKMLRGEDPLGRTINEIHYEGNKVKTFNNTAGKTTERIGTAKSTHYLGDNPYNENLPPNLGCDVFQEHKLDKDKKILSAVKRIEFLPRKKEDGLNAVERLEARAVKNGDVVELSVSSMIPTDKDMYMTTTSVKKVPADSFDWKYIFNFGLPKK